VVYIRLVPSEYSKKPPPTPKGDNTMRAKTTFVSKAAIETSRKYPEKNVWYFAYGNNECFVIGGNDRDAFLRSGIAPSMLKVEKRLYQNGRKIG
jgi:hypothetical protein